ncbi:MAG: hypothetical protein ACP5F9_03225 [Thiomonas sp.]|jgi:hypothetical protein
MDRIAALADILPPAAPPPAPPPPWWVEPSVWLAAALVAILVGWTLLWLRRSRGWRALRAAAKQAMQPAGGTAPAAARLAACLRALLPETDWPLELRARLDALRFAPLTEAQARVQLQQLATELAAASAQAARAAWWRPVRATVVLCTARPAGAQPTCPQRAQA